MLNVKNCMCWYSSIIKSKNARRNIEKPLFFLNFMFTPCINNIQHFNNQLMHTTLKKRRVIPSQCTVHTPHRSQYAAITLTTSCTAATYLLLIKCVIFSWVLIVALWWWFSRKPKHVEAFLLILKYFNNSTFFNVVCISWLLKCWTKFFI